MSEKVDPEKIKYFVRSKINQYLKNKPYSSAKLREKLLILPKKYPNHSYYPHYSEEIIEEVITEMEKAGIINNELFADELYQNLEFRAWSNRQIWEYLQYKQLYPKEIIDKLKDNYRERDETVFLNEIIRKLKIKITKWKRKLNDYELQQRIQMELYKDKWAAETVELILETLAAQDKRNEN